MKEAGAGSPVTASFGATAPPIVHEVLRSPGQPLDATTRSFMEPRFGRNFSGVRVHTDARATESARVVGALAYTVGNHIIFDSAQPPLASHDRNRMLAQQLHHVIPHSGRAG